jgi:DNA-directed RNA polymerase I and III subunit RPAC1
MREKISIIKNAAQALKAQIEGTSSGDVDMVDT